MVKLTLLAVLGFCCIALTYGDTPANCTYSDIVGTWTFQIGPGNNDRSINCSKQFSTENKVKIHLLYPDVAIDEYNNKGFWTLIYNQGFEAVVAGRKFFGFSYYEGKKSFCDTIKGGWSHNVLGQDWACFNGKKNQEVVKEMEVPQNVDNSLKFEHRYHFFSSINSDEMVAHINRVQKSWRATKYSHFDGLTKDDFINMAGGKGSRIYSRPQPAPLTEYHHRIMQSLPDSFDWRNVNEVNFVSPVRNQASCGSCYAFGSLGMDEARVRIQTNNTQKPVFSTQDIVECSPYSQGCAGGFPYLIGGKYAEDYGLVLEKCNPYKGKDGKCQTDPKCPRHYFTNYRYVGGYYGACNEALMMQAIYERGPIAVAFFVYSDFFNYKSGVYHHTDDLLQKKFNPFEITNHAVLAVGWGVSEEGEKYWIVKNSWGESWGQSGYFWIRRGTDECSIESIAVESTPVYTQS